jgi:RNA polymerase sigma factor (sigma-70 family)
VITLLNKDSRSILLQLEKLDKDGFITVVYNRYGKKLYSYAIVNWNVSEDEAWDLIYKTIYKVLDCYPKYTFASEEKFSSFIFKIFINYLRNHIRDTKVQRETELTSTDFIDPNIPETKDRSESTNKKLIAMNEVLDSMEDWERILLLMRSAGNSYSEIAAYINKPKVYYQRLKEKLAKKLNEF